MYELKAMIDRIKELKKKAELTNKELALKSDIPEGTLNKILGSETKDPQVSNIIKIAHALGVTADDLIFGKKNNLYDLSSLSNHETAVITAYREKPDMQPAVDRLLGIEIDQTVVPMAKQRRYTTGRFDNTPNELKAAGFTGSKISTTIDEEKDIDRLLKENSDRKTK